MNPTKQNILTGEKLLAQKQGFLDRANAYTDNEPVGVRLLVDMKKVELEEQVATITQRLEKLRKQYIVEFEAESKEANEKMGTAIMLGKRIDGKEPVAISGKVQELIEEVKTCEDQERKNDIFYELQGHIKFLKEKVE